MNLFNLRFIMLILLCILVSLYSYFSFVMFQDKSTIITAVTINGAVNLKTTSLSNTKTITANKICIGSACLKASHIKAIKSLDKLQTIQTCINDPNTGSSHTTTCFEKNQILNIQNLWPIGSITLYFGPENKIPSGWGLCDGKQHDIGDGTGQTMVTPDLSNRFLKGADENYIVCKFGGNNYYKLTKDEIPSHTHVIHAGPLIEGGPPAPKSTIDSIQYIGVKRMRTEETPTLKEMTFKEIADTVEEEEKKAVCATDEVCDTNISVESGGPIDPNTSKEINVQTDISNIPIHKKAYYIIRLGDISCLAKVQNKQLTSPIHNLKWETEELTKIKLQLKPPDV